MKMIKCNAGNIGLLEKDVLLVDIESERMVLPSDLFEFKNIARELATNQRLYSIINYGAFSLPTPEARAFCALSQKNQDNHIKARAIVVNDTGQFIMARHMLKSHKQKIPTRIFTDMTNAKDWISELKSDETPIKLVY